MEGREVQVLSSEHESGKQLDGLEGGIAAILRFPLEDLGDKEEEHEDEADVAVDVTALEHVDNDFQS
ncbi:Translation factor pelota [Sticta canariensis]|nr:Translation factor pelota [Sticta canariensis]